MSNLKNQDERTLLLKRKVQSDAFQLLSVYLLIAIVVQKFLFNAPFNQIAVEFIGVIVINIYVAISNILLGNNLYPTSSKTKKNIIIGAIISGLVCCIMLFILAGISDFITLASIFICTTIYFLVFSFLLYYLNRRKQKKIEEELNNDENNLN